MNYSIIDIETINLETVHADKIHIHCLSVKQYKDGVAKSFTLINPDEMRDFLSKEETLILHNGKRFDIPVLQVKLGIDLSKKRIIDTLALSWYLYPDRDSHNLYDWAADLGTSKPLIESWEVENIKAIIERCEEDVNTTDELWNIQSDYLLRIYETPEAALRLCGYLTFKLDCAREQEEVRWKLDVEKTKSNLEFLLAERVKKLEVLSEVMPPVVDYVKKNRPKVMMKKDGEISEHGKKWHEVLKSLGLPEYHVGTVKVPSGKVEKGNPKSPAQVKAWLFSSGWIPQTFAFVKEEQGFRKIPQVNTKDDGICESVKLLYTVQPDLEHIEGLGVLSHRIGILEGFLQKVSEDGFLKAEIQGFTNTLRFQHVKPLVNLPTVPKPFWEYVRGVLIAPDEDHILCGSDMSGLEDQTKRHFMWDHDPEYVKEMMSPDFDPHCDIAKRAGMMTVEEQEFYNMIGKKKKNKEEVSKEDSERYEEIKGRRLRAKRVNFGCTYGAGAPKLALTGGFSLEVGQIFHRAYWKRNRSIKTIASRTIIKTVGTASWLFNPLSQFWYSLRDKKDTFSTLNQSAGSYCFDTWLRKVRAKGIKICYQSHDEHVEPILKTDEEEHSKKLLEAIKETNEELQLNVTLGISIDFGANYSLIH